MDKRLPFGLCSAPFLFNRLADSLHWILVNECGVVTIIHYLDDSLTAEPSAKELMSLGPTRPGEGRWSIINHGILGHRVGCFPTRNSPSTGQTRGSMRCHLRLA